VISMGNSLKKRVIAEGVETREQLDFLTTANGASCSKENRQTRREAISAGGTPQTLRPAS
jgi:sensor c-di-GMP phosphodiesterase-like protein